MNAGRTVFCQVLDLLPQQEFHKCVRRYQSQFGTRGLSCFEQFLAMAFAPLTGRESLRESITCLSALGCRLYHAGSRSQLSRSTLADANERRPWQIYADFAQVLIQRARQLYADEPLDFELEATAYALDSTPVALCMALFPWARFRKHNSAIKLHTLLDLRAGVPGFIWGSGGRVADLCALDQLPLEPGAFCVMDRGSIDYRRLHRCVEDSAFFIVRAKSNLHFICRRSRPVDKATGLRGDQTIVLKDPHTSPHYPEPLRRISYTDADTRTPFVFRTNNFQIDPLIVAQLHKNRWAVELFFKWIKQPLRIQSFFGHSPNAVKTQSL